MLNKQKGQITLLALFIGGIVISIAIAFTILVKEHIKTAEYLKIKLESMIKAQSTYNTLIYCIIAGNNTNNAEILYKGKELIGKSIIPLNGQFVDIDNNTKVSIQDSNGQISVYSINTGALKRLIKLLLPQEKNPDIIVNSLLDWINPNPFASSPNGAGNSYYQMNDKPYLPRHYLLQYEREFELVRGMDEEKYNILKHCLTILPTTGFNPNTANDDVLKAYLDINQQSLETLKAYLKNSPVYSNEDLFRLIGRKLEDNIEGVNFYPSPFWTITIEVGSPKPVYKIEAGISKKSTLTQPYSVLFWKE
jgi:general secretion pathway protein K